MSESTNQRIEELEGINKLQAARIADLGRENAIQAASLEALQAQPVVTVTTTGSALSAVESQQECKWSPSGKHFVVPGGSICQYCEDDVRQSVPVTEPANIALPPEACKPFSVAAQFPDGVAVTETESAPCHDTHTAEDYAKCVAGRSPVPPSPAAQTVESLTNIPDDQIDTSDIPEVTDWTGAIKGKFYRPIQASPERPVELSQESCPKCGAMLLSDGRCSRTLCAYPAPEQPAAPVPDGQRSNWENVAELRMLQKENIALRKQLTALQQNVTKSVVSLHRTLEAVGVEIDMDVTPATVRNVRAEAAESENELLRNNWKIKAQQFMDDIKLLSDAKVAAESRADAHAEQIRAAREALEEQTIGTEPKEMREIARDALAALDAVKPTAGTKKEGR